MEYIKLNQNVTFSRIVQGLWRLTNWNWSPQELAAFMNACVERGVTTFDTAEIYGDYQCEVQIGQALSYDKSLRSKIQIVTKTGINKPSAQNEYIKGHYDTRYDKIIASCKASIEKMNCGYIDTYLIHREDKLIDHKEVARAFTDLIDQGLIRSAGVSNFDPHKFSALNHFMSNGLVTNQIECNPTIFEHFDSGMMDYLQEVEVPPMIWSPLAGGQLFTSNDEMYVKVREVLTKLAVKYNVEMDTIAYAWLLNHPVKMIPISGSSQLSRLDNAIKALDIHLTNEEWYDIYRASGLRQLR